MTLAEKDNQAIWHPYSHYNEANRNIALVKGEGALLFDEDGNTYIDAIGSWWLNLHGHAHPYIAQKINEQFLQLEHAIFAGFTHPAAVRLAERLLQHLPDNMQKIFFSDNGSTSTEVALKMAVQHRVNQGVDRHRIIAFEHAYHGDTFGSMSVGARGLFNQAFERLLFPVSRIPVPVPGKESECLQKLEELVKDEEASVFIFEPLLLAAGGMQMYSPAVLDEMIALCRKHGVITIADEVVTGFGRTGTLFASDQLENKPDIICLAKGLTGGAMTMGLTVASKSVFAAFMESDKNKTFYHGHSFTGNPLGCAASNASLDLLLSEESIANRKRLRIRLETERQRLENHPLVGWPRRVGSILAFDIQLGSERHYLHPLRDQLYDFFISKGVLIRPLGNTISMVPPYCTTDEQLDHIFAVIHEALEILQEHGQIEAQEVV